MKPIENSNLKDWKCTRRISGLIKLKVRRIWGVTKNLLRRNSSSQTLQNWRIVLATREESDNGESVLDSNSGCTEQGEFLQRRKRIFTILSEQLWSVPHAQPSLDHSESQRNDQPRFWLDTRNTMGTLGNAFESPPAREGPFSSIFEHSKSLAPSSVPRFQQGFAHLNPCCHAGGTYSLNGTMDCPRCPISELHLGKCPNSTEFLSWKSRLKSADLHLTRHWIKRVETAKSIYEHMTSRSIVVRTDFLDYDMLDTMIASAMKSCSTLMCTSDKR